VSAPDRWRTRAAISAIKPEWSGDSFLSTISARIHPLCQLGGIEGRSHQRDAHATFRLLLCRLDTFDTGRHGRAALKVPFLDMT